MTTTTQKGSLPPPPGDASLSPAQEALWRLVYRCEAASSGVGEPRLSARLSFATGRVCEELLEAHGRAEERYLEAFGRDPEWGPNLRAARRLKARAGDWKAVLDLIDRDLAAGDHSPESQAELYVERGTILERHLGDTVRAREAYACAMELDETNPLVWLRLAAALSRSKRWAELDDLLGRVFAQAEGTSLKAALLCRRAALAAERLDEPDRARRLFEEALELSPASAAAYVGLKRIYRDQQAWAELIDLHERELKLLDGPAKIYCYCQLARLYTRRLGRADMAIEYLEKARRIEPDDVLVLTELGRLYEAVARFDDQVEVDEHLLDLTQDTTERLALHHRIGLTCEEHLGDDHRAMGHYRAAVEVRPTYGPAIQALGRLYRKHDMLEELLEMHKVEARQAREEDRQALAHYRAAEMLEHQLGRVDEAVEQYEEAVRWVPSFLPAQQALERLYAKLERWEDLIGLYENEAESLRGGSHVIDRQDPLRVARLEQIGRLWEDAVGDLDKAAETYERILETDPGHVGALYALKRIYTKSGKSSALMELLEREVELVEDEAWAASLLHRIGEIAEEQLEDRDLAVVYYRRALTIRPSYVPTLAALGRIYIDQGKFQELLTMERKEAEVTELPQRRAAISFRTGEIYEQRLDDLERAEESYREALELDPELWPALRALERLLGRRRRWAELAEVLEDQAAQLESPLQRAVAFYRVGELWEDQLGKTDNAWDAYNQALASHPAFYPARVAMARLARRRGHWTRLAEILSDQLSTVGDGFAGLEVLAELGAVWRYDLDSPGQACEAYGEMTALVHDELSALLSLAEIHWSEGCGAELAEVCRRLADGSDDPMIKVGALRELATILSQDREGTAAAKEVWAEVLSLRPQDIAARQALGAEVGESAIEVERPEIVAAGELLRALAASGDDVAAAKAIETLVEVYAATRDWSGLDDAFAQILARLEDVEDPQGVKAMVKAARARLEAEHTEDHDEAEERLRAVLAEAPDDVETRAALAELLARDEGRREVAVEEHQRVLLTAPCRLESVRALELLWREAERADAAHLALSVLSAFRATSPEEEEEYNGGRRALQSNEDRTISRELLELHTLSAVDDPPPPEAVRLLRGLEPHLAAVYPPDLGAYGLTRDDRIPPPERLPLRQRGEPLGYLLGVPSFDIYLHEVPGRSVGLEMTDPPSLILPSAAASWPAAEQTFALGQLLGELALGTWLSRKLTAFELHRLLVAATRIHVDDFAREMAKPDAIDNLRRKLERTLPPSVQGDLEPLARAYAERSGPPVDTDAWVRQMRRVSRRVGLLACGDLDAALAVIVRFDEDLKGRPLETSKERVAAFERSEAALDMIGWFLSDEHFTLRRIAGFDGAS